MNNETKKNQHIMVVEDEHHLAVGIKFNLEAEGYRVTVAGDGKKALALFSETPADFDMLILDVMLPGMNGYDLCETLRKDGFAVPVLILSARTLAEDKARGFDAGANQYLVKPFELDELLSRVKNLLSLSDSKFETNNAAKASLANGNSDAKSTDSPGNDSVPQDLVDYEFADCRIDFLTFEVNVRGESVKLTTLQMKLLKYFVSNPDRVIPRSELLESVWDMPGNMQTRAPDQFISMLRKTFEPDPANPVHFVTIRDAGYRFVPAP